MSYLIQSDAFRDKKNKFFSKESHTLFKNRDNLLFDEVEKQANDNDYDFVIKNQKIIETEFLNLFAALSQLNDKDKEQYWLWCYYCASLLDTFYSDNAYEHKKNKKAYGDYKQKIKDRLHHIEPKAVLEVDFLDLMIQHIEEYIKSAEEILNNLWKKLNNEDLLTLLKDFIYSVFSLSRIRDLVVSANLYRIYWVFSRLTLTSALLLAEAQQWIVNLDLILGIHTDINQIISIFQSPTMVLNFLSVGFFLTRFIIDSILLIRHTFFPSELEKNTLMWERFKYEFYKRHLRFANDLVWATVNFLTNFNKYTQISDPIALYIIGAFLIFDISTAIYQLYWSREEYLIKKAQYIEEINVYRFDNQLVHVDVLNLQLKELELNWQVQKSAFYFQEIAATLFLIGFTASFLLTAPALIVCAYFVCVIAVAMYLSGTVYSQYREKAEYLEQHPELDQSHLSVALQEYEIARRAFIFTLTKNIIAPVLLITVFALYWPAALILTAVYIGIELGFSYKQHLENNEAKRLQTDDQKDLLQNTPSNGYSCEHEHLILSTL